MLLQRDLDNKLWAKKGVGLLRENFVYLKCAVASKEIQLSRIGNTLLSRPTLPFTTSITNVNSFVFFTLLGVSCVNCAVTV